MISTTQIEQIFKGLKNSQADVRLQSAVKLQRCLSTAITDISADDSAQLWDEDIHCRLFELVHSQDRIHVLGGLVAIDHIIIPDGELHIDSRRNLFRLWNYVKHLLPNQDVNIMLMASKTLGQIASVGSITLGESFMEKEIPAAIEMVQMDEETSKHAGVLILKELSQNSSMYFHPHISTVLENITKPLHDRNTKVREGAAELLAACLEILMQREDQAHTANLAKILEDAQMGLKQVQPEVIHGSLLTCQELLLHAGTLMHDSFLETVEQILKLNAHTDLLVRRTVVTLIPTLAAYNTEAFIEHCLERSMACLLSQAGKHNEQSHAIIAIGDTAVSIGDHIEPFLHPIMVHIERGLQNRGQKHAPLEDSIFYCIGLLAKAIGPHLTGIFSYHLDAMLACGLSESLHQALVQIVQHNPTLLGTIQDRLLAMFYFTLTGQPYTPRGNPVLDGTSKTAVIRIPHRTQATKYEKSPEHINLVLSTLGSFDFTGHALGEYVHTCVLPYLKDENAQIRRAAAVTCSRLVIQDPICHQTSDHAVRIISDVVSGLVGVGIADADPEIRNLVLSSLQEPFDKHLAQAENIRSLLFALNDEAFENRVLAVELVGRLSKYNPAYVTPTLRKMLNRLLVELDYSTTQHSREECTRMLTVLISVAQQLIEPYALQILHNLVQKADTENSIASANIFLCLGELISISGEKAISHIPTLMHLVLSQLSESPGVKRDAALHTLLQICSSTGYVIAPLIDYPQLLGLLEKLLRSETTRDTRREVVKVLGVIGALDPHQQKIKLKVHTSEGAISAVNQIPVSDPPTSDDYFLNSVFTALLLIMKNRSLSHYHPMIFEAIMSIFKTQGLKCIAFLPQIIPTLTTAARNSKQHLDFYLEQIAILIRIVQQHIRNLTPDIVHLLVELWENATLQSPIITVIEALGDVLGSEFKPFLPTVIPMILQVFDGELNDKRLNSRIKVFDALMTFGIEIEEYIHLVLPIVIKSCQGQARIPTISLQKRAIQAIGGFSRRVNLSDQASRIIHPLIRILNSSGNELRMTVMDTLCCLAIQLGTDFAVFIPSINKCLLRKPIAHSKYQNAVSRILRGEKLYILGVLDILSTENLKTPEYSAPAEAGKLTINQPHLTRAWDTSQVDTQEDWFEWIRRVGIELVKESPSHAFRACIRLMDHHLPFAQELFNVAFLSCWNDLDYQYQEDIIRSIELALTSNVIPSELVHRLLDLAEFMEHEDKPLPIDRRTLAECSMKYMAYAKALYYNELEFFYDPGPATIESLISINTRLQRHETAWGLLSAACEHYDVTKHGEWYERLGRWQEALSAYERKAQTQPNDPGVQIGRMKCLHALGEWDLLASQVEQTWSTTDHHFRREIAPLATAAAWSLCDWDSMSRYLTMVDADSPDHAFYHAILSVRNNKLNKALVHIAKARDILDSELNSFSGEGYDRSYKAQMLSELEEIVTFKKRVDQPEHQLIMRKTWMTRLQGCQPDVEVWQRILQVRTLVLSPEDSPLMWIKFVNLCRKSNRMALAEKTIHSLLPPGQGQGHAKAPPHVIYAHLKFMWATGAKEESLIFLRQFSANLSRDLHAESGENDLHTGIPKQKLVEIAKLLARCYFKMGEWQVELGDNWGTRNLDNILHSYYLATHFDETWYKAWHTWALTNFNIVGYMENQGTGSLGHRSTLHVIQAIEGFFQSISLRNEGILQDTLRLLTLWFKFGSHDDVSHAMSRGFAKVEIGTWLVVIPQIIARIQTPHPNIQQNISNLLSDLGKHHPQALVHPLVVASKSPSLSRRDTAHVIINRIRAHSQKIITQAQVVGQELVRIAMLWHEMWHESIGEALRPSIVDTNPEVMVAVLEPLHKMLDSGPSTPHEVSFVQSYGNDLQQARSACHRWSTNGDIKELEKACAIYTTLYTKLDKQILQWTTLDLQYISPNLLKSRNLDLAVPGTYQNGQSVIKIAGFLQKPTIIGSKQRPRRLILKGSDGRNYQYLLKGHEDLRQDERVMQLFSLVNNLISIDKESFKRRLHIQRFPIIPLAPNAGLIGWVQGTDPLHVLIRDYRESKKVLLNIEYRLMLQMAPDYENLPLIQKIEVFEYAWENTTGQDLYRTFWLKSANSEHWVERRATYTRSLAVNSMVGHILGLGDRHPSNLIFKRTTGEVVHIDFGDCFEVAMHREIYPEKVPFRLTRMLTNAMEISGIEGSFRKTCEITMQVLRANKESLMAVMETFVYDPLINWRLLQGNPEVRRNQDSVQLIADFPYGLRRKQANETSIFSEVEGQPRTDEVLNERALYVYNRVEQKLTGRDFDPNLALSVEVQVDRLIKEATAIENLCQSFSGWCAFW